MRSERVQAGDTYVWLPEPAPAGEWVNRAACRGQDRAQWFPGQGDNATYRTAVKVCIGCPVRLECLDYALVNRIKDGIWGGLGERRRRPLAKVTPTAGRAGPLHGSPRRYAAGCHCTECREAHRIQWSLYRDAARRRKAAR